MNDLRKNADTPPAPRAAPFDGSTRSGRSIRGGLATAVNATDSSRVSASNIVDESAQQVRHIQIDADDAGQRLDNLLIRLLKGVPRSHIYQLVRSGQVRINGARVEVLQRLAAGDKVRIPPVRVAQVVPKFAPATEFPVVYEDAELLVINKPEGVAVHGGSGISSGVIEQLRAARPEQRFLELVHRIDRDTSGLLMIAKKRSCLLRLQQQLRVRSTEKSYLAVVRGRWPLRTKTLRATLHTYTTAEGERRVSVSDDGRSATTHVLGIKSFDSALAGVCTLVSCRIETGRMHQIRVHLAHAGFPIVGDQKYGDFDLNKTLQKISYKRMFLHAFNLTIGHPEDTKSLLLEAPMPDQFTRFMSSASKP